MYAVKFWDPREGPASRYTMLELAAGRARACTGRIFSAEEGAARSFSLVPHYLGPQISLAVAYMRDAAVRPHVSSTSLSG